MLWLHRCKHELLRKPETNPQANGIGRQLTLLCLRIFCEIEAVELLRKIIGQCNFDAILSSFLVERERESEFQIHEHTGITGNSGGFSMHPIDSSFF